jgi:hypothetical protein
MKTPGDSLAEWRLVEVKKLLEKPEGLSLAVFEELVIEKDFLVGLLREKYRSREKALLVEGPDSHQKSLLLLPAKCG